MSSQKEGRERGRRKALAHTSVIVSYPCHPWYGVGHIAKEERGREMRGGRGKPGRPQARERETRETIEGRKMISSEGAEGGFIQAAGMPLNVQCHTVPMHHDMHAVLVMQEDHLVATLTLYRTRQTLQRTPQRTQEWQQTEGGLARAVEGRSYNYYM